MDPIKAAKLGVKPEEVQIACEGARYNGDWLVYVDDPERGKLVLTSGRDIYNLCWWRTQLHIIVHGRLPGGP